MIKVLLADDHSIVREGICSIIKRADCGIEVNAQACNGFEVIELARKNPSDIYILDISMPFLNGIETALKLRKIQPKARIIFLSMHDERNFVQKALECGAKGYLLKANAVEEVVNAIKVVYDGKVFLSPKISGLVLIGFLNKGKTRNKKRSFSGLTNRERQVLQLIAEGFSNKEIASKLKISFHTIHAHRVNVMSKLNIHSNAALVKFAVKEGISSLS
jgi:two-component system, NarL family, response regulator NreC